MPLSEEELRLLEQMERALVQEDPKFASTLRGTSFRRAARRRAVVAGVVFAGGVAVMMTGVITAIVPLGIVGFVVMLGSATIGLAALSGRPAPTAPHLSGHLRHAGTQRAGLRERLGERWRRRRGEW